MKSEFKYETSYFTSEGKANLDSCLSAAFKAAIDHDIQKLVIFTAAGQGVRIAIDRFLSQPDYASLQIIAVTFPHRSKALPKTEGEHTIANDTASLFREHDIPIVRANLPFDPIESQFGKGLLGQDLSLIGNALTMFCGSMSLCVQAALMACDAGHIDLGEHVICLTSDTAILVRAATTTRLLTDFVVREIICKPVLLTLAKSEPSDEEKDVPVLDGDLSSTAELPQSVEDDTEKLG